MDVNSLHVFRQCSYPVILMKILTEFQVRHSSFSFFSGGTNSSFVDHILSSFQMLSHASAPLNYPILAIHLFHSAEDISKSVSTCIRSSSFEIVISFKSFNSTGAFSFSSNLFNGVSFEWALTHRSFL